MNNTKALVNSINHRDYRLNNDFLSHNEDDTLRYEISDFSFFTKFSVISR